MQDDNTTENQAENETAIHTASVQDLKRRFERATGGFTKPKPFKWAEPHNRRIVTKWEDREDWLATCVDFGMSVPTIVKFSLSWPQSITTHQQLYEMIERLGLTSLYKRRAKWRTGDHNKAIIGTFTKVAGQLMEYGHELSDVRREESPIDDGPGLQMDWAVRVDDKYWFLAEVQLSKTKHTKWATKIKQFVRLYKLMKKPFRVLMIVGSNKDLSKIRAKAREALKESGHPNLNLFLFITSDQFRAAVDVVKAPIWHGAWEPHNHSQIHSLL